MDRERREHVPFLEAGIADFFRSVVEIASGLELRGDSVDLGLRISDSVHISDGPPRGVDPLQAERL